MIRTVPRTVPRIGLMHEWHPMNTCGTGVPPVFPPPGRRCHGRVLLVCLRFHLSHGMIALGLLLLTAGAQAAPLDTTADAVLGQPNVTTNAPNQPSGLPTADNLSVSNAAHVAVGPNGRLYVSDADNNRVLSWPDAASFADGDAADMVIGQPDFVSSTPNNGGVSASGFFLPQGLAVDAAGNLWVADAFNSRVLKFNNPLTDATPTEADLVIGQPDFVSNAENLGQGGNGPAVALQDSIQFPGRVVVRGDDVYVADSGNSRVLHYTAPTTNKPFADLVFGQFDDFTRRAKNNDGTGINGCCASVDNLFNPIGLALDAEGNLYVADWNNHRVLRYDSPTTTDTTADAVYGQPDFISRATDNGGVANGFQLPIDLAFDRWGNLYVADSGNNRLLRFDSPRLNSVADGVFGQLGSFSAEAPNHGLGVLTADADGLFGPTGMAFDALGNLYVVDTNNQRVLRFDTPFSSAGDLNCDGLTDLGDVAPFVSALTDPVTFAAGGCPLSRGDLDFDGNVDGRDIGLFVSLLLGN